MPNYKKVPKYLKEQIEKYASEVNEARKEVRDANYNWETMTPQQRAVAEARGNVGELKGDYKTGKDLRDLEQMYYHETDARYMENYIATWVEYCVLGDYIQNRVIEDIRWIVENKPGTLRKILERGYQCTDINFIYPKSADLGLDLFTRHNMIYDFWEDVVSGMYD